jgi:hypothetical protein
MRRISRVGPIALFLVGLWLPMIQMAAPLVKEPPNTEHRQLATAPNLHSLSYKEIKGFARELRNYLDDNLGFRRLLIRWNSIMKIDLLKMSSIGSVIVGKDGWLFYNHPTDGASVRDFEGELPLSPVQLGTALRKLEGTQDRLSGLGIHFLVIVVPNKQTVYPEYLPEAIQKRAGRTRMDQLAGFLRENAEVPFLDIRSELAANKHLYPVYQRTDTHFTGFGSFLAYEAIMREVSKNFQNMRVLELSEMTVASLVAPGNGDLAEMMCLAGFFEEHKVDIKPRDGFRAREVHSNYSINAERNIIRREIPGSRAARLLMFGDSFSLYLAPYLSESFSRTISLQGYTIDYDLIEREHPDVVILEICERYLESLLT